MKSEAINNLFENINASLNLNIAVEKINHCELTEIALAKVERNIIALALAYKNSLRSEAI